MGPSTPNEKGDLSKVLGILALIGGFTAIFLPMRTYVETQTKMQEEDARLRQELAEMRTKLSILETKLEIIQTWPPPVSK